MTTDPMLTGQQVAARLWALIEEYAEIRHHMGQLAGGRHAHRAGDFQREADAVSLKIRAILNNLTP